MEIAFFCSSDEVKCMHQVSEKLANLRLQ